MTLNAFVMSLLCKNSRIKSLNFHKLEPDYKRIKRVIKFGDLARLNLVEFAYAFLKSVGVSFVGSKTSIFVS